MQNLASKVFRYYKSNGVIKTAVRILRSLKSFIFVYRKAVMRCRKIIPLDSVLTDNLNVKIASKKDIDEEYQDIWTTKEEALEKLDKGHILFLVKDHAVNVFYAWVYLLNIDIPWLDIKNLDIPADVAYFASTYAPPQYRGRLFQKRILKFSQKYFLENTKVDKIFGITSPDNIIVSRLNDIFGYLPYQQVKYFKVMGVRFYIVESLEDKKTKRRKIFIQNANFWNVFSSILKGS